MSSVLSYKFPPINPSVSGNAEQWVETRAMNGSVFRSDQNQSMMFNIASNSQFLKTVQSFLTGTIVPRASDGSVITSAATTNTTQGISRAFNRLTIRFGGRVVEDIKSYSDALALYYATESLGKKSLLARLEGYGNTAFLQGGSVQWAHMILSSLWVTDQCLPLPLIPSGGITIELYLAPASELFTSTNVSYYTLENCSFKWQAVTPDPTYTLALRSAVAQGRSAYIAYQKLTSYPSNGNGSNSQIINVTVGQVSSVASVETVFWDSTTYNAVDKGNRFTNAYLTNWSIEGAGIANPNQIYFQYQGGASPETILLGMMSSVGNIYQIGNEVSLPTNYESQNFRIGMNYQSSNEYFGTGLSTVGAASPFLTIKTEHSQAVPTSISILTFVTTDALIEFRGIGIEVTEVF